MNINTYRTIALFAAAALLASCGRMGKDSREELAAAVLASLTQGKECTLTGTLYNGHSHANMKNSTYTIQIKPNTDPGSSSIAVLSGSWGSSDEKSHSFSFNVKHIPRGLYYIFAEVNGADHTISGWYGDAEKQQAGIGCQNETQKAADKTGESVKRTSPSNKSGSHPPKKNPGRSRIFSIMN